MRENTVLLFLSLMLSMTIYCKGDILSQSSITLRIYGGYSDVKSTQIVFESRDRKIVCKTEMTYWKVGRTPIQESDLVPESLYVDLWSRITELGVWQLGDAKYAGEDFETYEIRLSISKKTHSFSVQNPSEQEEAHYYEIVKEVIGLYNLIREGN